MCGGMKFMNPTEERLKKLVEEVTGDIDCLILTLSRDNLNVIINLLRYEIDNMKYCLKYSQDRCDGTMKSGDKMLSLQILEREKLLDSLEKVR